MAQYIFRADDFDVGTKLEQLGWSYDDQNYSIEVVQDHAGRKAFQRTDSSGDEVGAYFKPVSATKTQCEIAAVAYPHADGVTHNSDKIVPVAKLGIHIGSSFATKSDVVRLYYSAITYLSELRPRVYSSNSEYSDLSGLADLSNMSPDATWLYRLSRNADDYSFAVQQVNETDFAEVLAEEVSGTDTNTDYPDIIKTQGLGIFFEKIGNSDGYLIAAIGIGTDGDSAPVEHPDAGVSVEAPQNLSVTNITETSATLNWE